jgi:hypothetical protein
MDMVLWQRACFFLTPTAVISIFRGGEATASLTQKVCLVHSQIISHLSPFPSSNGIPPTYKCSNYYFHHHPQPKQVHSYFQDSESHSMELSRRPCFVFYRLVESLIQQIDEVLVLYRQELLACEARTFKQVWEITRLVSLQRFGRYGYFFMGNPRLECDSITDKCKQLVS